MARLTFQHDNSIDTRLQKLGNIIDKYAEDILEEAAKPVKAAVEVRLGEHVRNHDLIDSIKIRKPEKNKRWNWKAYVYFAGKDRRGIRNGLKAGVLEYGKANQDAAPFVEESLNDAEAEVNQILGAKLDEALRAEGLI